ncbi:hypothetical protein HK102_006559 [Quaeritorhiza haematococci]|nr:hypothetical protein HK102_006559 [Quaeritorhiza haematococci]
MFQYTGFPEYRPSCSYSSQPATTNPTNERQDEADILDEQRQLLPLDEFREVLFATIAHNRTDSNGGEVKHSIFEPSQQIGVVLNVTPIGKIGNGVANPGSQKFGNESRLWGLYRRVRTITSTEITAEDFRNLLECLWMCDQPLRRIEEVMEDMKRAGCPPTTEDYVRLLRRYLYGRLGERCGLGLGPGSSDVRDRIVDLLKTMRNEGLPHNDDVRTFRLMLHAFRTVKDLESAAKLMEGFSMSERQQNLDGQTFEAGSGSEVNSGSQIASSSAQAIQRLRTQLLFPPNAQRVWKSYRAIRTHSPQALSSIGQDMYHRLVKLVGPSLGEDSLQTLLSDYEEHGRPEGEYPSVVISMYDRLLTMCIKNKKRDMANKILESMTELNYGTSNHAIRVMFVNFGLLGNTAGAIRIIDSAPKTFNIRLDTMLSEIVHKFTTEHRQSLVIDALIESVMDNFKVSLDVASFERLITHHASTGLLSRSMAWLSKMGLAKLKPSEDVLNLLYRAYLDVGDEQKASNVKVVMEGWNLRPETGMFVENGNMVDSNQPRHQRRQRPVDDVGGKSIETLKTGDAFDFARKSPRKEIEAHVANKDFGKALDVYDKYLATCWAAFDQEVFYHLGWALLKECRWGDVASLIRRSETILNNRRQENSSKDRLQNLRDALAGNEGLQKALKSGDIVRAWSNYSFLRGVGQLPVRRLHYKLLHAVISDSGKVASSHQRRLMLENAVVCLADMTFHKESVTPSIANCTQLMKMLLEDAAGDQRNRPHEASLEGAFRCHDTCRILGVQLPTKTCNRMMALLIKQKDDIQRARIVYDNMVQNAAHPAALPDVYSMNIIIGWYAKRGVWDTAVRLFQTRPKHIQPDRISYTSIMTAFAKAGDHAAVVRWFELLRKDATSAVIPGGNVDAEKVDKWQQLQPNEVAYGILIGSYLEADDLDGALSSLKAMASQGVRPNAVILTQFVRHFGRRIQLEKAEEMLSTFEKFGLTPSVQTWTVLIDAATKAKNLRKAEYFFSKMIQQSSPSPSSSSSAHHGPDMHSYSSLLNAYARLGDVASTISLFRLMRQRFPDMKPTLFTMNAVLSAFVYAGDVEGAESFLPSMVQEGKRAGWAPDSFTRALMMKVYAAVGNVEQMNAEYEAFMQLTGREVTEKNGGEVSSNNASSNKPVVSQRDIYNILLNGHAKAADIPGAVRRYNELVALGYQPDVVTFSAMVECHANAGNMLGMMEWWGRMKIAMCGRSGAGALLDVKLATVMVQGFVKMGKIEETWSFLESYLPELRSSSSTKKSNNRRNTFADSVENVGTSPQSYQDSVDPDADLFGGLFTPITNEYAKTADLQGLYFTLQKMSKWGVAPTVTTLTSIVECLERAGEFRRAVSLWDEIWGWATRRGGDLRMRILEIKFPIQHLQRRKSKDDEPHVSSSSVSDGSTMGKTEVAVKLRFKPIPLNQLGTVLPTVFDACKFGASEKGGMLAEAVRVWRESVLMVRPKSSREQERMAVVKKIRQPWPSNVLTAYVECLCKYGQFREAVDVVLEAPSSRREWALRVQELNEVVGWRKAFRKGTSERKEEEADQEAHLGQGGNGREIETGGLPPPPPDRKTWRILMALLKKHGRMDEFRSILVERELDLRKDKGIRDLSKGQSW